jgi:phosphate acetyltransferase
VVGGIDQSPESVANEVRNAHHAYTNLGCDVIAVIANRVSAEAAAEAAERLRRGLPVPAYVLPEEPALSAPTVAQVKETLSAEVLLGDHAGLARDVMNFVFGGAMLPTFIKALTPGCMVIMPGDRADLLIGSLAAHSAGAPPIAGIVLTLDERPGPEIMALAARLAPGTPVLSVPAGSFPTAADLFALEGKLGAATPRNADVARGVRGHLDGPHPVGGAGNGYSFGRPGPGGRLPPGPGGRDVGGRHRHPAQQEKRSARSVRGQRHAGDRPPDGRGRRGGSARVRRVRTPCT